MKIHGKGIWAIVILALWVSLGFSDVALGESIDRAMLTERVFQDRLNAPVLRDGVQTVDLTNLTIDLRSDNTAFRDRFYPVLQRKLNETNPPLALDLSGSIVRGNLDFGRLGLNVPLYGSALSPLLSVEERQQLERDRRRLSQLRQLSRSSLLEFGSQNEEDFQVMVFRGRLKFVETRFLDIVDFTNTFFLDRVDGIGAVFAKALRGADARFSQTVRLTNARFSGEAIFQNDIFFEDLELNGARFEEQVRFRGSTFKNKVIFHGSVFNNIANFENVSFLKVSDFSQTNWQDRSWFSKAHFSDDLILTNSSFMEAVNFRESQLDRSVNLRSSSISGLMDFSDTQFSENAHLNVSNLTFDSEKAMLSGNPGQIGRVISIPTLQGNENLLKNLIRNFRKLEQIEDVNLVDCKRASLKQKDLIKQLFLININTASFMRLQKIGLSDTQIEEIFDRRQIKPFTNLSEILILEKFNLTTYVKVRDRIVASPPLSLIKRFQRTIEFLSISILLLLSQNGTSFELVFGIGVFSIAYFGVLFWGIDRFRRQLPAPIVPKSEETVWMLSSFSLLIGLGLSEIFHCSPQPLLTLICLSVALIPVPAWLLFLIYKNRHDLDLINVSYFVEDGSMRQLRLTIGRLPVIPRCTLFRDRYEPILFDRRWNWLNYYDLSSNNLFKFCFNDIRLRDREIPGSISALVWYQWGLGLFYVALLLWTLSRTIPGLNLFLYLK